MNTRSDEQPFPWPGFMRCCWTFCIILTSLCTTVTGYTAVNEYQLEIEFSFNTQAIEDKKVTGYHLYEEGNLVCETIQVEPLTQIIACPVLSKSGTYAFTLSALFDDGSESPQSNPFPYTLTLKGDLNDDATIDLKDIIIGLQVLMNLNPGPNLPDKKGDVNEDGKIGLEEVLYCLKNIS